MPRIVEMYAFVAEDSGPDDEGIIGMNTGFGWMPLVGADMARIDSLRPIVLSVAKSLGKPIKLLHFTKREELEVLEEDKGAAKVGGVNLLSKREKALLSLVAQGLTNREIATSLFISEHTVKVHLRNIMGKLHAHTRQKAVALARENRRNDDCFMDRS